MKKDCLDLPPKIYSRRTVELADVQKKAYADLVRRVKIGALAGEDISKPISKLNIVMYAQKIL